MNFADEALHDELNAEWLAMNRREAHARSKRASFTGCKRGKAVAWRLGV